MQSTKEIKNRIGSIKSTAKITKALQLVSAVKMQKAQNRYNQAHIYAQALYELVNKLGDIKDFKSPFLRQPEKVKNIAIVVIGTDRGFVGSMISNLIVSTFQLKDELEQKYPHANILGVSLHKTGLKIIQNAGIKSKLHFSEYNDAATQTDLTAVYSYLIEGFSKGEFDLIYVVYARFVNTISQVFEAQRILPIEFDQMNQDATHNAERETQNGVFTFEPDQEEILNEILPQYFQTTLYTALLSSIASEYSSRMVAMKNATDNANDLMDNLTLEYNKSRQAGITQQIIEVVSGALK